MSDPRPSSPDLIPSLPRMSGPQFTRPQSSQLSGLGQCWSLDHSTATKAKNSFRVYKMHFSCLLEKATDNAVKDYSVTTGMCVSQQQTF